MRSSSSLLLPCALACVLAWALNSSVPALLLSMCRLLLLGPANDPRILTMAQRMTQLSGSQVSQVHQQCVPTRTYSSVERISNTSMSQVYSEYLYQGLPVIVTDAAQQPGWEQMRNLTLSQLARLLPTAQLTPRSGRRATSQQHRGVRLWERAAEHTPVSVAAQQPRKSDPLYYSYFGLHRNETLLGVGVYRQPYFADPNTAADDASPTSLGEWIYLGSHGTGVIPHTDAQCLGKFSYQVRGTKRWTLSPTSPHAHFAPTEVLLSEGETLVWLPDHLHGTHCVDTNDDCISVHGYMELPLDGNCYLQAQLADAVAAGGVRDARLQEQGFVRYQRTGSKPINGAQAYLAKCPHSHAQWAVNTKSSNSNNVRVHSEG